MQELESGARERICSTEEREACKLNINTVNQHYNKEIHQLCADLGLTDDKGKTLTLDIDELEDDKAKRLVDFVALKMKFIIADRQANREDQLINQKIDQNQSLCLKN